MLEMLAIFSNVQPQLQLHLSTQSSRERWLPESGIRTRQERKLKDLQRTGSALKQCSRR
jgi:hypothetical protein